MKNPLLITLAMLFLLSCEDKGNIDLYGVTFKTVDNSNSKIAKGTFQFYDGNKVFGSVSSLGIGGGQSRINLRLSGLKNGKYVASFELNNGIKFQKIFGEFVKYVDQDQDKSYTIIVNENEIIIE